jgi:shikimate dehydrogenase
LNVTIPYKEEVIQFLTEKNEIVKEIVACNCIKIDGDKLIGFNTDVVGFQKTIEPQLKPHHKKALILGTGGASKAIAHVLQKLGIEHTCVSRRKGQNELGYENLDEELLSTHDLIVNTTPLGMWPNIDADPSVPYDFLTPKHFLYDVIYNPAKTKFLAEGEKRGAQICNGHQMLIEQAEESWRIWNS